MILSKTEVHCDCNFARNWLKRVLTWTLTFMNKTEPPLQGSESSKWPMAWLSINETSLMLSESEESDSNVMAAGGDRVVWMNARRRNASCWYYSSSLSSFPLLAVSAVDRCTQLSTRLTRRPFSNPDNGISDRTSCSQLATKSGDSFESRKIKKSKQKTKKGLLDVAHWVK